ncbi:reverse transcriptase domain-containing protein [Roseococcus suduntuyensis]|uniref:Reverse transcriptase domain-containing protein n=1 Tax=Roseococcus suduntuyensis TaxID=455361 RepID=A0A840AIN8_9PROT|nr:reverse transcriptase domain-containing protein [Roseococcus suduntuyensis]MBB3900416.1 hypothetical protein [Roseococcus suduntuyensis]
MITPRSRPPQPTGNRHRDLAMQAKRARTSMAAGAALGHMLAADQKRLRNAEAYLRKHAGSRKARRAARRLAGAFAVKLAHVATAARKGAAQRAPEGTRPRMSAAEVVRLAEEMRPNRATASRITMRVEAKRPKPGDVPRLVEAKSWTAPTRTRRVFAFGMEHKARQGIVAWLAGALHRTHPHQFTRRGRGLGQMQRAIADALTRGHLWAVRLDIKDFFDSFCGNGVRRRIALPAGVVENSVLHRTGNIHVSRKGGPEEAERQGLFIPLSERLAYDDIMDMHTSACRTGLPQGSAASGIIADILLAPIFDALPDGAEMFIYCDDILILTRDRKTGVQAIEALRAALSGQGFPGSFRLTPDDAKPRRVSRDVEFCGLVISMRDGQVNIAPKPASLAKAEERIRRRAIMVALLEGEEGPVRAEIAATVSRYPCWRGAVPWTARQQDVIRRAETIQRGGRALIGAAARELAKRWRIPRADDSLNEGIRIIGWLLEPRCKPRGQGRSLVDAMLAARREEMARAEARSGRTNNASITPLPRPLHPMLAA